MTIFWWIVGLGVAWVLFQIVRGLNPDNRPRGRVLPSRPAPADPMLTRTTVAPSPTARPGAKPAADIDVTHEVPLTLRVRVETSFHSEARDDSSDREKDAWEGSFWEVQQPVPVAAKLALHYVDGNGNHTDRVVDVREFGSYGDAHLMIAHCHLRDATRTFRTDRIVSCTDVATGELINDVAAYLQAKYDHSPERTRDTLMGDERDVLRVLLYIGKADGQLRAAEKQVIRDACVEISSDTRLTTEMIEEMFSAMSAPSIQAFKIAVGRLAARDEKTRQIVSSAASRIVATQKTIHASEKEALEYMAKRFGSQLPG